MTFAGIRRRDVVIASILSVLGLLLMYDNVWGDVADAVESDDPEAKSAVHIGNLLPREAAMVLFLLVTVPLLWRRVSPLAATAAAFGGLLVNIALLGTEFLRCGVIVPTAMLFGFAAASRLPARQARIGLLLSVALVGTDMFLTFDPVSATVMTTLTAAVWGIGRLVYSRKRLADQLEERTAELREARDERARMEVATDRARLSAELDELLHRRLGELARLAGDGTATQDSAAATATLVDIERESRRTLEEMRAVVGVLREQEEATVTSPQPTLTHLEALLVQAKGRDARLIVEGNPRVLPPGVELSAYRIVEHLLDALDDSTDVGVCVRFDDQALELEVTGTARRPSEAAIQRARERVQLHHGTLTTSLRGGRADVVAQLPVLVEV